MEESNISEFPIAIKIAGFLLFLSLLIIVGIKLNKKHVDKNNCKTPDPVTTGYDLSDATETLDKDDFSVTGIRCATGYTGEPSATPCGVAGEPYTLSGCGIRTCADINGDGTNEPFLCSGVSINSLDPNPDNIRCSGTTCTPEQCCTASLCVRPDDENYNFDGVTENLTKDTFEVNGITCAIGTEGSPVAQECNNSGEEYILTGCTNIDRCSDNPCGEGARCIDTSPQTERELGHSYSCNCEPPYYGPMTINESATCRQQTCADIDPFSADTQTPFDCGNYQNDLASNASEIVCSSLPDGICTADACCTGPASPSTPGWKLEHEHNAPHRGYINCVEVCDNLGLTCDQSQLDEANALGFDMQNITINGEQPCSADNTHYVSSANDLPAGVGIVFGQERDRQLAAEYTPFIFSSFIDGSARDFCIFNDDQSGIDAQCGGDSSHREIPATRRICPCV